MSDYTDKAKNEKLDLYWQKLCAEHDVEAFIKRLFDKLKEKNK